VLTVEVDPHDDTALRAWHAALSGGARAGREAPLVSPYDAFTLSLRSPGPRLRRRRRRLHTWTAESNAPMQTVNARFGFRPVEKLHEMELRT
jgi:hypothetical protein